MESHSLHGGEAYDARWSHPCSDCHWKREEFQQEKGYLRKECDGKANGTEEKSGEHGNKEINKCFKEGKGCFKETVKKAAERSGWYFFNLYNLLLD